MKKKFNGADRAGEHYGRLIVLGFAGRTKSRHDSIWHCRCECGRKVKIRGANLKRHKSCGCEWISGRAKVKAGDRYGRLIVLSQKNSLFWLCRCDCGATKAIRGASLRLTKRPTKSCGCLSVEIMKSRKTHGMWNSSEYGVWQAMLQRCNNKNNISFQRYGGRGVKVCRRWRKFKNFLEDVGRRPSRKLSLERIDNLKGYKPGNVKWATRKEQQGNTRSNVWITFQGRSMILSDWASEFRLHRKTLGNRLRLGWPMLEALTTKLKTR